MHHVKLVKSPWIHLYYWSRYKLKLLVYLLSTSCSLFYLSVINFCLAIVKEMSTDSSKQVKLGFITGLVPRQKSMAFERILFRATRGNVFLRQAVVEDPVTDPISGEKVSKKKISLEMSNSSKDGRQVIIIVYKDNNLLKLVNLDAPKIII